MFKSNRRSIHGHHYTIFYMRSPTLIILFRKYCCRICFIGCQRKKRRSMHDKNNGAKRPDELYRYAPVRNTETNGGQAAVLQKKSTVVVRRCSEFGNGKFSDLESPVWRPLSPSDWNEYRNEGLRQTSPPRGEGIVLLPGSARDSGLDLVSMSQATPPSHCPTTSWLAEVKIIDSATSQRPNIYVKPLVGYHGDTISITAL